MPFFSVFAEQGRESAVQFKEVQVEQMNRMADNRHFVAGC